MDKKTARCKGCKKKYPLGYCRYPHNCQPRLPKNFGKMSLKLPKLNPILAEIFNKPADPNEHLPKNLGELK